MKNFLKETNEEIVKIIYEGVGVKKEVVKEDIVDGKKKLSEMPRRMGDKPEFIKKINRWIYKLDIIGPTATSDEGIFIGFNVEDKDDRRQASADVKKFVDLVYGYSNANELDMYFLHKRRYEIYNPAKHAPELIGNGEIVVVKKGADPDDVND